jgi:hypothetical protein
MIYFHLSVLLVVKIILCFLFFHGKEIGFILTILYFEGLSLAMSAEFEESPQGLTNVCRQAYLLEKMNN